MSLSGRNANPKTVYGAGQLNVDVQKPPGAIVKYKWFILAGVIVVLAIVAFILMRRSRKRARINVRGLQASLRRGGEQVGAEFRAPADGQMNSGSSSVTHRISIPGLTIPARRIGLT